MRSPDRRVTVEVSLPGEFLDRLAFVGRLIDEADVGEVICRAIRFYDRATCAAVVDGARIEIVHRNQYREELDPK
jgi:hypothetical protein